MGSCENAQAAPATTSAQEKQRIAIHHSNERSLGCLRRRDHFDYSSVGAFARRRRRLHLECLSRINRAAPRCFACPPRDRDGLSRHGRLVERRARTADLSIDRNHLASAHQKRISDRNLADRHIFERFFYSPVRHARRAVSEGFQVPLGAPDRKILQHIPTGIHDGDDHSGECLAERQRGRHRYERNRIDAHSSRQNIAND
jgi:hypothetical protein